MNDIAYIFNIFQDFLCTFDLLVIKYRSTFSVPFVFYFGCQMRQDWHWLATSSIEL